MNHLRLFEVVYRTKSMTAAASKLHLTQSGVSQHIRSLEEILDIKLFDRIKQRLVPTGAADALYKKCETGLNELELGLQEISSNKNELFGTISIGIPLEFGNDIVLPLLAKIKKMHPKLKFDITVGLAAVMNEKLLRGELDFAFVDSFISDKRLQSKIIFNESLELCISSKLLNSKTKFDREFFESLSYVAYQEGELLLRMWFSQHYNFKNLKLNVQAYVMDAYSVANMVRYGFGAGIIPGYLLSKIQKDGYKLTAISGPKKSVRSPIGIAWVKERTLSNASIFCFDFLCKEIKEIHQQ